MNINAYSMSGQFPRPQLSPEEEARLTTERKAAVSKFRLAAIVMTIGSVACIAVGIAILALSGDGEFPIKSGAQIWSATVVLIGAIFGLILGASSSEWKTESDRTKQRCLVIVFYVFAVTSLSFCGLCVGYSIWGSVACGNKNESTCGTNFQPLLALNIIAILLSIGLFGVCMAVTIMFCVYRKQFQFYGRQDQMAMMIQMQQTIIQQQQQLNAQGQGQTGQPNQYSQYGYGTQWSSQPPSYSEVKTNKF